MRSFNQLILASRNFDMCGRQPFSGMADPVRNFMSRSNKEVFHLQKVGLIGVTLSRKKHITTFFRTPVASSLEQLHQLRLSIGQCYFRNQNYAPPLSREWTRVSLAQIAIPNSEMLRSNTISPWRVEFPPYLGTHRSKASDI